MKKSRTQGHDLKKNAQPKHTRFAPHVAPGGFVCAACMQESPSIGGALRSDNTPPSIGGAGVCVPCADRMASSPQYRQQAEAHADYVCWRAFMQRLADTLHVSADALISALTAGGRTHPKAAARQADRLLKLTAGSVAAAVAGLMEDGRA